MCDFSPPRLLPWNEDVAAWGTFYKYGLTGYTVFTGPCGFGGIAGSKKLSVSAALRDDPCAISSHSHQNSLRFSQALSLPNGGKKNPRSHRRGTVIGISDGGVNMPGGYAKRAKTALKILTSESTRRGGGGGARHFLFIERACVPNPS